MSAAFYLLRRRKAVRGELGFELRANPDWGLRINEEHCPECDIARSGGDELERVAAVLDASHAHDRDLDRGVAGKDRRQRDGLQRRSRIAADARSEHRAEGALVELEPPDRIHR